MGNDGELYQFVWIFNGVKSNFPSAVFRHLSDAETWITNHSLSGVLTRYPLDIGAYDYAISRGIFTPKNADQETPLFIGKFSSASFEHYHYEDGKRG